MTTTNGNIIVENIKVGDIPDSRVAQGIELFWIESKRYLNTL